VRAAIRASAPASLSLRHMEAVRRSCHTMALWIGLPLARVPHHGGLALVGDADRRDVARRNARLRDRVAAGREHGAPNIFRIVLDPSGLRKVLGEFLLNDGRDGTIRAEHNGAGGRCALVDGEDVSHRAPMGVRI